jgi:ABC-type branched-subunit amino acid transport system ATPase component
MSDNLIEAKNLTKRYDGVAVVNGISFSVARFSVCSVQTARARPPRF